MKYFTLVLLASCLLFIGCDKEPEEQPVTSLELTWTAHYDGEPFLTFKDYTYPDGRKIQFNNFNFFVSDISLISSDASAADLNRCNPSDYGYGHPLTRNFWDGWASYIFSMVEGAADMDNDGTIVTGGANTESFTYHSGTDEVYNEVTINQEIILANDNAPLQLKVDVAKLFRNTDPEFDLNGDGFLDIETFRGTHSANGEMTIAKTIMDNFSTAVTLE